MTMSMSRWTAITESQFTWERDALDWLRAQLPDRDPWHVWTNFEFIDDDGKVNEVDALVLSPTGLFLVEIKSRPGVVMGDAHTWTWETDGRTYTYDNPLILANRKAKRLAGLLQKQSSVVKSKTRLPWVEPIVFLSALTMTCKLAGNARARVYLRGRPGAEDDAGIVGALRDGIPGVPGSGVVNHQQARTVVRATAEAGVRPSNKHRRVGEYQLVRVIGEGQGYQDWEGRHISVESVRRRIRISTVASASSGEARKTLVRHATREFQILEGIDHPGILKVREYAETELGPALIFDYDPKAIRLDFLLREAGGKLNVDQRLHIVRQLAETLKYAHKKKLYHRALCPQSILVRDPGALQAGLQIMNWQTGAREATSGGVSIRTTGTLHIEEYVEDFGRVYLAPESASSDLTHGPHLDVFSLGAIAFHVFGGQPPAGTAIELHDKLRSGPGLRVSDVMDAPGKSLQDLIQFSTIPDVSARFGNVDEFLGALEDVEDELTTPDPEATVDPSEAKLGERIEGGFTVVKRLGKGSSSDVLLVKPDGKDEELVLKVASESAHNDRLVAEGEVLEKLRHTNIVQFHRRLKVAGRTALLMAKGGDPTLAQQIRSGARLSLDLMRRFGDELIQTVDYLDQQGVAHRDIKPENIGMSKVGAKGKLQLTLFDFSLSRAPAENITAGTHPYLDPFLSLRRPPRWDLWAERFALGVTLYEMVTGSVPRWGDGKTAPAMLDCEAALDTDRFDPHLRDALTGFFEKALRRDPKERFDNAEEMLRAWRRVFEDSQAAEQSPDAFESTARLAGPTTSIAELGYGVEAQNVLEGMMGIHNARELLAVERIRFRYLKGVGDKVRKEIRLKAKKLAQLRPDLVQGRPTVHDSDAEEHGVATIDELARHLLPKRPAGDDRPDDRALAVYLGLEEIASSRVWPTLGDAASNCQMPRSAVSNALIRVRERWLKSPLLTEVREEIVGFLSSQGGIMTVKELASALLSARGSAERDDDERLRLAAAVLRACAEAEADLASQRFQVCEAEPISFVAESAAHADYASRLGQVADELARNEPLLAPQRAAELLEATPRPDSVASMPVQRLLKLATSASTGAALSSRHEIYPRGMPALQAIRQSVGALVGTKFLSAEQVADRVRGRYPDAEQLPARPSLDDLLDAAGANLSWSESGLNGAGYYSLTKGLGPSAGTTTVYVRYGTHSEQPEHVTEAIAEARQFEERLTYAVRAGGFLALTVPPRFARHAEDELMRRFDLERLSCDALLLSTMKKQAGVLEIDWQTVLAADAALPGSRDWTNLTRLVHRVLPEVREQILAIGKTVLLLHPGLLARYQLMQLVEELRDKAGRPGSLLGLWMLVPMTANGLPMIDGVPVPVISSAQWARVPHAWIENVHRAGTTATT